MKKEESINSKDNSLGTASVVLGILSIVLASVLGVILGIIALVSAVKQQKLSRNVWGRRGKILAIVGIILSIIVIAVNIYIAQNPEVLTQLLGISTLPY